MNENNLIFGFEVYIIPLILLFIIAYGITLIWVIREGYKRDILNFGLIAVALLGTPFMAAAFVSSTKKDSDRLIIDYTDKTELEKTTTLTKWIKLKSSVSSITRVYDINNFCRFCNADFNGEEQSCSECGKSRIWFKIIAYNINLKRVDLIKISELKNTNDEIEIKGIKRQKHPLQQV